MSENFTFLQVENATANLFTTANMAEKNYTQEDYDGVLSKGRKLADTTASLIIEREGLEEPARATFDDKLRIIKKVVNEKYIIDAFYDVKRLGNLASHEINSKDATKKNALNVLHQVFVLLVWFINKYTDTDIKKSYIDFLEPQAEKLYQTAERKLIYIQTALASEPHKNTQKIGDTSVAEDDLEADWSPNSDFLRATAAKRISQYMTTSGLDYDLGWAELAYRKEDKSWFTDHEVHRVLRASGYKQSETLKGQEWYDVDLETAKKAIQAVKEGRETLEDVGLELETTTNGSRVEEANTSLTSPTINAAKNIIKLRPEQEAAVKQTQKVFRSSKSKNKKRMLWNAKMRFGKTLTSLQLIKEEGYQKVLILSHRPVVSDSWGKDFDKMDMAEKGYRFGSKDSGASFDDLKSGNSPFIYFVSMQKLRYGNGETNLEEFAGVDWDLIIIDEAHEGTQTDLAGTVMNSLIKDNTRVLELSGTPFNILDQYEDEQVYTWDYTMEQRAKLKWSLEKPDLPNPYESLPKVSMFTFDMKNKAKFATDTKFFNFREFFKVDADGELVYKADVKAFLDNITNKDSHTNYPFSTEEYRNSLRHTLWIMPGVKEANAFEKLLKEHKIFGQDYKIVNVVKNDKSDETTITSESDLEKVREAIGDPSQTKTITLTVRKLTTGVNVPEWNAVLFLSNMNSPMNYLQAAFRAQTPFSHEKLGVKKEAYVFDFAPDRALTIMAESAQINSGVGKKNTVEQKEAMINLLNFMPILGTKDTGMDVFDVDKMLTQLKRVYAEKAVRTGFDDESLYNDNLLTLTEGDATTFRELDAIVGKTQGSKKTKIIISDNGLTDLEYELGERAKKKKKGDRSKEEEAALEKSKEAQKERKAMISILRGVSIRIPMMIYGMDVDLQKNITIDDFINLVDAKSWEEFMPKGFTKRMFKDIAKYYDPEVFVEAGQIIRERARSYDYLDYVDRAEKIAELFASFKNPDKETVLTPWRVVNMQLVKSLGGLNFYDDDFTSPTTGGVSNLHWVENDRTESVYSGDKKFLDINAKTGLYPLHVAMSLYYKEMMTRDDNHFDANQVYRDILKNNVHAIAKTPMAKTITQRTLAGYKDYETSVEYIDGLVDAMKESTELGVQKVEEAFKDMKFDVVVGNPPYQENNDSKNNQSMPIYNYFYDLAEKVSEEYILISPARFLSNQGATPKAWNRKMLRDNHIEVIYFNPKSSEVFPNTDIKGGVIILHRDENICFETIDIFIPFGELRSIYQKVSSVDKHNLSSLIYSPDSYKLSNLLFEEHPEVIGRTDASHAKSMASSVFNRYPEIFFEDKPTDKYEYIQIYGRFEGERTYKWIKRKYVADHQNLDKWKVFIPGANGSGAIGEVLSTPVTGHPVTGHPVTGHTQTFVSIGNFSTQFEAESLLKYLKGKFSRAMLGIMKTTQNNQSKETWSKVPLQDFTQNSDIDWSKSIPEIDQQLYKKYNLSQEEIDFIEDKVRAME
ncbi:Eco57I restriction-modification methylase domain-containing protein [Streptococcaceae bacterium ESL0729]|nr:Eco57I restriction-modification methylase domain-containing protein [Streptococcaceae bacterium ESL0729]